LAGRRLAGRSGAWFEGFGAAWIEGEIVTLPDSFVDAWAPRLLSVLRIVAAFMFMAHGTQKLVDFPVARASPTPLWSLIGIAGMLEMVGGALLLFGLFTRPVAFVLSGLMAFAYFLAHAPHGFWPIVNRGELAVLYSFVFLYLAVAGGGVWSVDRLWKSRAPGTSERSPEAYPAGRA
jgi:putative oxidoreductase